MTTRITWGDPFDPRYFLIYLNTWETPLTDQERVSFADHLWGRVTSHVDLKPLGLFNSGISLVLHRPNLYAGAFGEILYRESLEFTKDQWPPVGAAEVAATRWDDSTRDRYEATPLMVSHAKVWPDADARARLAFHGLLHSVGKWVHPGEGPEDGGIAKAKWSVGVRRCALLSARHR